MFVFERRVLACINIHSHHLQLYFGLLIFVGYIVVDTQMIIEKAHHGDMDYVRHSFTFFTDFASLFVQILVLNMVSTSLKPLVSSLLPLMSLYLYNFVLFVQFRKMKKGRKDRRN